MSLAGSNVSSVDDLVSRAIEYLKGHVMTDILTNAHKSAPFSGLLLGKALSSVLKKTGSQKWNLSNVEMSHVNPVAAFKGMFLMVAL